ncbi:PCYCGC motif-containing (lipo)protein [Fredinandcohnia humi]
MKHKYLVLIFILLISIVGCSQTEENHESHKDEPLGDIREESSIDELPSFLDSKPDEMVTIYKAAAAHEDLLKNIPCYCGCADSVGHKDSYDCFVHERKEKTIVWDDHGTKCGVCMEIAATSILEYQNGKSITEIRNLIDETYKEGYAEPTPTPLPKL